MRNRKLLVISSGYPNKSGQYLAHTFVKGFVDQAKAYYDEVAMLVILPIKPTFLKSLANRYPKSLRDYSYDNVKVYYRKYPYLPVYPFKKFKGKIAFQYLFRKLSEVLDGVTHVHANFTVPSGMFANLLAQKIGKDFVLTVHENHDWLVREIESENPHLKDVWRKAKAIVRVNEMDRELLTPFNDNVQSIPNGYDHNIFKPSDKVECRKALQLQDIKRVIVNIGFYKEHKNQKMLIDAIHMLPREVKNDLHCLIIGGGPLENELIRYVKSKKLNDHISIVGKVPHFELPKFLAAADIFCLPSDSEGNPTVMFEALGVGIPYVGTDVGGVPEIITSDEYGLLCKPRDTEGLKNIIEASFNKQWDQKKILKYSQQFTWENIVKRTRELY